MKKAIFAAGCFWGVQYYFDQVPGVVKSVVGYIGGHIENPTWEEVCTNETGHAEAVELEYDDKIVSYETLLRHFFRMHDPTQLNRQGPDIGEHYRSSIYYVDNDQKIQAQKIINELQSNFKDPIVTKLEVAGRFYPAENYHQKFTETTGRGMCRVDYEPVN